MSAIDKLRQQIPLVVAEYFQRVRDAEAARESETRAVTRVQAAARGFLVRRRILHLTEHAVVVQRCWRGYLGRLRAKHARELHYKRLRQVYFDTMAIHIQRRWRGFWSRKHVHNFYARKAYLEAVRTKSEAVRQELNEEAERAMAAQRQAVEEAARRLFDEKIARLHHLTSTVSQPGIFNSPYSIATGTLPVIAGVPVEEHLRVSSKAQVKQRLPPLGSASGKVGPRVQQRQAQRRGNGTIGGQRAQQAQQAQQDGNGSVAATGGSPARRAATDPYPDSVVVNGERIPRRLTLRQSVPYDTLHVAEVLEEKVHRGEMLTKHPLPFYSALSLPPLPTLEIQSNRNVEHYGDPYDPTIGVRNEHFTPVQQRISAAPFLKYMRKQPFFDKAQAEAY